MDDSTRANAAPRGSVPPGGAAAPDDAAGRARTRPAVVVVVAALALECLALLWLAVEAVVRMGTGALPAGAQVMLLVIYMLVAAWIGATAVGLARGRAWTRGAATAVQLFGTLLSWWLISGGAILLGAGLLVVSGAGLLALFTRAVTRHLDSGARPAR